MNDATITGEDMRLCVCCGGFVIAIKGQTKTYLVGNPDDLNLKSGDKFPIALKIDWYIDSSHCGNYIKITRFKRLP